ncbi:Uncharacterized protein conserved in bacteria [Salmonella enterica subsp. diarizonae]|uniref:Uncharacterized protein conserved in bacteria n=1 Tax=Salmonella diarizonae TaxID=59204 RepID=A0A379U3F7_SALDZ|nr:Uncharacterized protein conserved in bacteria [Salmonella enterica subsp. diarizonae]
MTRCVCVRMPEWAFRQVSLRALRLIRMITRTSPPTVRTTFMGLYGITSPLPTQYIDDITQRREGHETVEHFLDISTTG